jgi:hypothetical protein
VRSVKRGKAHWKYSHLQCSSHYSRL